MWCISQVITCIDILYRSLDFNSNISAYYLYSKTEPFNKYEMKPKFKNWTIQ